MNFQAALAALRQTHPNAELGNSVQEGGSYYQRATAMTYRRIDDNVFRSVGGSRMWLYYSNYKFSSGGIFCGPKVWPEYENL